MKIRRGTALLLAAMVIAGLTMAPRSATAQVGDEIHSVPLPEPATAPPTLGEARARARILHQTIHGTLQVVHRDFFRKDESTAIPSRSLEEVFDDLSASQGIELKWLAVNTPAMDVDHEPDSDVERDAVAALTAGKTEFESVTGSKYVFVGPITLSARCLSCHAPLRKNNDDRLAALRIQLAIQK